MAKRLRDPSPALSPLSSLLAAVTVAGLVLFVAHKAVPSAWYTQTDIAVEHEGSTTLSLSLGKRSDQSQALLELSHRGTGSIAIGLPTDWTLTEVRGGAIKDVTIDTAEFGNRLYHVPPGLRASFRIPSLADRILMHNPSHAPLMVEMKMIDLRTSAVSENRILIQDKPTPLW